MPEIVDARGLDCPQPVILTKKAMEKHTHITTIVDSETSCHNVTRMAEKNGFTVSAQERGKDIYLSIRKGAAPNDVSPEKTADLPVAATTVVVSSEYMGRGDDDLGQVLIRSFFHTIAEAGPLPGTIIFYNSGVKLAAPESAVLEDLRLLCDQGVAILACGTCLAHFGLKEKLAVGEISNMYAIAEILVGPGKVIKL